MQTNITTGEVATRKLTLLELDEALDQIAKAWDDVQQFEHLSPDDKDEYVKEAIDRYFGDVLDQRDAKVDAYANYITALNARSEIRRAESKRLAGLAKTDENLADMLKDRLKFFMEDKKMTKFDTPYHKLWIQNNGGALPVSVTCEPEKLPEIYQIKTITPDAEALRSDLTAGGKIEGCPFGSRGLKVVQLLAPDPFHMGEGDAPLLPTAMAANWDCLGDVLIDLSTSWDTVTWEPKAVGGTVRVFRPTGDEQKPLLLVAEMDCQSLIDGCAVENRGTHLRIK